jgi:hypothetical protein
MRETAILAAVLVLLKVTVLIFDPTVRLFFGDSASYLHSAMTGWIPPDRSFVYGLFVRDTALAFHSMFALAMAQSALGVITSCALFRILRDSFSAPLMVAALLAIALALEPAQLFHERMVMAESCGTAAFALMLYAGFAYLRRPHWAWPIVWAFAGILAVALRMSMLPVVLGFAALPVLASVASVPSQALRRQFWAQLVVALIATASLHCAYTHLYGTLSGSAPDYIADNGYFRLGLVAPLVTREEVIRAGLPSDLLDRVGQPLADPRAREAQIWQPDGLIARVREAAPDGRAARKLAAYAVRGDPLGLVRLAASTIRDYFDVDVAKSRMTTEIGDRPANDDLVGKLLKCCDYDARGLEAHINPVARYFSGSTTWLIACYLGLLPLAIMALVANWHRARAAASLLTATALGMVLAQALFSHIVSFRYLHPFPLVFLLGVGAWLGAVAAKARD